jgi:hypothetical protein
LHRPGWSHRTVVSSFERAIAIVGSPAVAGGAAVDFHPLLSGAARHVCACTWSGSNPIRSVVQLI